MNSTNRKGRGVHIWTIYSSYRSLYESFNNDNEDVTGKSFIRSLVKERCWKNRADGPGCSHWHNNLMAYNNSNISLINMKKIISSYRQCGYQANATRKEWAPRASSTPVLGVSDNATPSPPICHHLHLFVTPSPPSMRSTAVNRFFWRTRGSGESWPAEV